MNKKSPPFVMITNQVLDSPAWRAMSHGARSLYVALKRRYSQNFRNNGKIYLSTRIARKELGRSGLSEIGRWFQELQYYGFIVMMKPGYLGVNGKGKAPRWRLTEVGYMRGTSSKGMEDLPTQDFLRWKGVPFSKHRHRGDHLRPEQAERNPDPENRITSIQKTGSVVVQKTGSPKGTTDPENRIIQRARVIQKTGSDLVNHWGGVGGASSSSGDNDEKECETATHAANRRMLQ
jgi:hypothetical protein